MPAPVSIARRDAAFSPDPARSPLLHPALSTSLSKSFGLNSPFSLSAMSTSLKDLSSSPGFSSMAMSLGRSFEERPRIEAQFFKNFTCCGLDLQDLHGLLEHFEECHVQFEDDRSTDGGMDGVDMEAESEGTISGPPSPRLLAAGSQRGVFEVKKSGLGENSFEAPDSPATHQLHLDGGMELDMEMGDDDDAGSPSSSAESAHSHVSTTINPQNLTNFGDNSISLQRSGSKKFSSATTNIDTTQGIQPSLVGFDPNASRKTSGFTPPASEKSDKQPNPIDALNFAPAGTVNPAQALGGGGNGPGVGGLAPSLLFNGTGTNPAQTAPSFADLENDLHVEPVPDTEETDSDSDSDDDDDETSSTNAPPPSLQYQQAPFIAPPASSLPPIPQSIPVAPPPAIPHKTHHTRPRKPAAHVLSPNSGLPTLPNGHLMLNPNDHATITALAQTTLKDPMMTAQAIAALGPNSLSALPTARHPLGAGVQISPSGRPYTPPSEKPFKCTVPGCEKSYKQQNGLKYHRIHGHTGDKATAAQAAYQQQQQQQAALLAQQQAAQQAAAAQQAQQAYYWATNGGKIDPKIEGKPYVCHVASCGKRYKNMNGLRYHYQHSGAHGALGLQMLAQGCHPPPQFPPGHKRGHQLAQSYIPGSTSSSRTNSPAPSRGGSPNYHGIRMGFN
ncbi:zinc-coordinating transcription factor SFP1 [Sporobolomyces salmoneus]|uniref:zinc-coordinating transcription factor SFP1 n=1 Tax=Sporobolomyces salmoneus TaxID=183962 RepID=UPI003172F237